MQNITHKYFFSDLSCMTTLWQKGFALIITADHGAFIVFFTWLCQRHNHNFFAAHLRSVVARSILHVTLWNFVHSLQYMLSWCYNHHELQFYLFYFPIFMPWPHILVMIERLVYEFECVSRPGKIHVHSLVCSTGAWIFLGPSEQCLDVNVQFGWTEGWFSWLNAIFRLLQLIITPYITMDTSINIQL